MKIHPAYDFARSTRIHTIHGIRSKVEIRVNTLVETKRIFAREPSRLEVVPPCTHTRVISLPLADARRTARASRQQGPHAGMPYMKLPVECPEVLMGIPFELHTVSGCLGALERSRCKEGPGD